MRDTIPVSDVIEVMRWALQLPSPRVCRHMVAGELFQLLERNGIDLGDSLARAILKGEDAEAVRLLEGR